MCGIVGLFLKNKAMRPKLGRLFAPMLIEMTSRGPDSAGVAVFSEPAPECHWKITVFNPNELVDWTKVAAEIEQQLDIKLEAKPNDSHCVFLTNDEPTPVARAIKAIGPEMQVMSVGRQVEIYKETGLPVDVVERFKVNKMPGSHAVGHTRMATESAVTTAGSHPFSTGADICLVHNGSLSNHNRLRDHLKRSADLHFQTENDTEVAAAFISDRLNNDHNLHDALEDCVSELDGFYTFVAGCSDGFAVLRDPIACKPAVLAETDDYVAFGSEYRALVSLPEIDEAEVWEPEPAVVYSWSLE